MTGAVDTSPWTLKREHREFLLVIHKAAEGQGPLAEAANALEIAMAPHLEVEERLEAELAACLEAPLVSGMPRPPLPEGCEPGKILKRIDLLHHEHRHIRHLAEALRHEALKESRADVACVCGRLLAHIAVEDGIVYPLAKMQVKLCDEARRAQAAV